VPGILGVGRRTQDYTLKLDPLIYDCLFLLAWLFLSLQNNSGTPSFSTSQACRPVPLVITDNQRPDTLSLPHGLAPPIKHTTHLSQAAALWTQEWQPCSLDLNKSFLSTCGIVLIQQNLIYELSFIFTQRLETTKNKIFTMRDWQRSHKSFFKNICIYIYIYTIYNI
jgi:hypothetical protein